MSGPSTRRDSLAARRDIRRAVVLLLLFALGPLLACEYILRRSGSPAATGVKLLPAPTFDKMVARLDKQKEQRSEWAYAAIVAIVAISVVKHTFKIPWSRPAYVLLGTAGAMLFQSIRAGDAYERNVVWLVTLTSVDDAQFGAINDLLWYQMMWLNGGASALLVFVGIFLAAVISGNVPDEGG